MLVTQNRRLAKVHSFDAQVLSFAKSLHSTARHLTRNAADAEDLVQDTFVKALRFSDRFRSGTNLAAWLRTILVNTHRNTCRRAARDPAMLTAPWSPGPRCRPIRRTVRSSA